jgi:hypothetical protein
MYKWLNNKVAQSLLGLSFMPARTLNDFFAGFFYGQIRVDLEAKMAITRQKSRRKGDVKKSTLKGKGIRNRR